MPAMKRISREQLGELIQKSGHNPTSLALAIGRDKGYISDYLIGRKDSLKAEALAQILDVLGVGVEAEDKPVKVDLDQDGDGLPVVGTIQAGAWLEAYVRDADETIPITRDPRFPYAEQYALRIVGDSMNLEAPEGAYAICVSFSQIGMAPKPGMVVHVERNMHDLSETTLKEIGYEDGKMILKPRSTNPEYQPIRHGPGTEIRGVVLSYYHPKKV